MPRSSPFAPEGRRISRSSPWSWGTRRLAPGPRGSEVGCRATWRGPMAERAKPEAGLSNEVTAPERPDEPRRVHVPLILKDDPPDITADEGRRLADAAHEEYRRRMRLTEG